MSDNGSVLFVEDDAAMRDACLSVFRKEGFFVSGVATADEALRTLTEGPDVGIVVTDLKLPGKDGLTLLRSIKAHDPSIQVVLMTGYGTIKSAVEAMKVGAGDYLTKPFEMEELLVAVRRLSRMRQLEGEVARLRTELEDRYRFGNIIGGARCMREVVELTRAAADSDAPVLLEGESGTGKELIARAIHYSGKRKNEPFVPVNCGALPVELFESEIFGHVRGAFTGAHRDAQGLFLSADRGSVFLDEITEMPLQAQVKLLRVLEDKHVRPVGDVDRHPVDVRVIAATNQGYDKALKAGALREDLFYRLGVILISLPPLRERSEDIPALAMHFVQHLNEAGHGAVEGFCSTALEALCAYEWPGNVRQLRNVVEGLYALGRQGLIDVGDLPRTVRAPLDTSSPSNGDPVVPTLQEAERSLVEAALRESHGNKSEASRKLGISRTRLYHVIRRHRIRM